MCFVHNSANEHALRKGYSKDPALTNLLGWFWAWVASRDLKVVSVYKQGEPVRRSLEKRLGTTC